jgi:iron complex outermembrane recepter protein
MSRMTVIGSLFASISVLGMVSPASADDAGNDPTAPGSQAPAGNDALSEIVVTAQKREQRVSDVSIAMDAFSAEQVKSLGLKNSTDLFEHVPGVVNHAPFGSAPGFNANIVIRGVGLNDFNDGTEAPVTTYIDEFYILPLAAVRFGMYDIARVEVLKGPQGTLFGRNSNGGLVHYITERPADEFSGYADISYGRFNEVRAEAALSGPLNDHIRYRFSALSNKADPYMENLGSGPDARELNWSGARGQIGYDAGDSFSGNFKAEWGQSKGHLNLFKHATSIEDPKTGLQYILADNVDAYGTGPGRDPLGYKESDYGAQGPWKATSDAGEDDDVRTTNYVNSMTWNLGSLNLTSVTGYLYLDKYHLDDCDGSEVDGCVETINYHTHEYSQELRLNQSTDKLKWTVGTMFLGQDAHSSQSANLLFHTFNIDVAYDQHLSSVAFFGQADYEFAPTLTAVAGVRYSREHKSFEQTYLQNGELLIDFTRANVGDLTRIDEGLVTAKLGLEWRPWEGLLNYATISRGAKAGGFNNGIISTSNPLTQIPYKSETLWAYELGTKYDIGRRFNMSAAAFYYDYRDFQAFSFEGLGGTISNHDAKLYGAEIEASAALTDTLSARLGASALHTELFGISNGVTTRDTMMALAPKFSVNGILTDRLPTSWGYVEPELDFSHTTSRYTDSVNNPSTLLGAYTLVNAQFTFGFDDGKNKLSVFAKNLFNEKYLTQAFELSVIDITQLNYGAPRTWGVSFRVAF